jgi:type IV pilus assembly protein PilC
MEFQYLARDKNGRRIKAIASADSVSRLVSQLKNQGLLPLRVFAVKSKVGLKGIGPGRISRRRIISNRELAVFSRQFSSTLNAGILLTEALTTIAEDLENLPFRRVLKQVINDIQAGFSLSAALTKQGGVFPATFVAMIRAGEESGSLDKTLASLAKYLEDSERMSQKLKSALRYPLFIFGFFVFVVAVIVFFLIPKFKGMFAQAGANLPLLTRIVVGVSEFAIRNALWIIVSIFILVPLFVRLYQIPKNRLFIDSLKLKFPLFGKIIKKALVSRFCRTLSILLSGGVGLPLALPITAGVVNNLFLKQVIQRAKEKIISGATLAEEIGKQRVFPAMAVKMVSIGEKTGKLDEMLKHSADYYDQELETTLSNFTSLLEPVLIVLIGGVVLIVVLALYLPIFKMSMATR